MFSKAKLKYFGNAAATAYKVRHLYRKWIRSTLNREVILLHLFCMKQQDNGYSQPRRLEFLSQERLCHVDACSEETRAVTVTCGRIISCGLLSHSLESTKYREWYPIFNMNGKLNVVSIISIKQY